ncbi:unnamed protein product [Cochlearia groenlandica]
MPTTAKTATDSSSLRCAACGCHRNFHRRDSSDHIFPANLTSSPSGTDSPPSPSLDHVASPVPFSYYTPPPPHHVLLSLTSGFRGPLDQDPTVAIRSDENSSKSGRGGDISRKRTRTKFTTEQKIKMRTFADKAGWRINGCDEKLVRELCNEIGIERRVFKVWMHNNKYSLANGKNRSEIRSNDLCLNSNNNNNGGDDGENGDGSLSS